MELSDGQTDSYLARPFKEKSECLNFLEDLLPSCSQVESSVPLVTTVNCLVELFCSGGSYQMLKRLWGFFRAALGPENPLHSLQWSRSETLVSVFLPEG